MKQHVTKLLVLLVLVAMVSSCGRTVYRRKVSESRKFIGYKRHEHFWHAHHFRPHARAHGGYW